MSTRRRGPPDAVEVRRIDVEVTGCRSCPFLQHVAVDMAYGPATGKVENITDRMESGYYCLHPIRRARGPFLIATHEMIDKTRVEQATLRDWLTHHWGGPFPGDCPLPVQERSEEPTGHRALDLGLTNDQ